MGSLVLTGDTSGSITLAPTAIAGSNTITLPATTGTAALTTNCIGNGQTWTDVTSSRANATTYTNSTGRIIVVAISALASGQSMAFSVDGVNIFSNLGRATYFNSLPIVAIIPAGSTYQLSGATTLQLWFELR